MVLRMHIAFYGLLFFAASSFAMEPPSFNPPVQWGERSKEVSAGSCPTIGGAYQAKGETMGSECNEKSCEKPTPRSTLSYAFVRRKPHYMTYKSDEIELSGQRRNQKYIFWIDQAGDRQYAVVTPYINGTQANVTIFEAAKGDFSCEAGLIKLGHIEASASYEQGGGETSTYDIQIVRMSDGALVYQIYSDTTTHHFFRLVNDRKREMTFIRYMPRD